jgi:MerR family mercuric resistance operon transcriptional regulator
LTVETVRYYERRGLLPKPVRTAGRQRRYRPSVVARLQLIQHAKALGLSLDDIAEILRGEATGRPCAAMHAALTRHLQRVDLEIATLQALRATILKHQQACADAIASKGTACPTWRVMEGRGGSHARHHHDK